MTIQIFNNKVPQIGFNTYVDPSALIIGDVNIGIDSSIWPMVVIRGDMHSITIGNMTNIQDHSVLHITHESKFNPRGHPLIIGNQITIGHRVTLHGCKIEDRCLIGMGSIIMDGAIVESDVIVGAGTLVPPGKCLSKGFLWMGSPARKIRPLKEEEYCFITYSAERYCTLKNDYLNNKLS